MEQSRVLRNSSPIHYLDLPLPSENPTLISPTLTSFTSSLSNSPLSTARYRPSNIDQYVATTQWSHQSTNNRRRVSDEPVVFHTPTVSTMPTTPAVPAVSNEPTQYSPNATSSSSPTMLRLPLRSLCTVNNNHLIPQTVATKLLQPLLDGGTFHVQHGIQPLPCTFTLNQNMSTLQWIAQSNGRRGSTGIGGNIKISHIVSAHQSKLNPCSMELTMNRGNGGSNVVLRLRAMSTNQCVTWISGIYYLRSVCSDSFFEVAPGNGR